MWGYTGGMDEEGGHTGMVNENTLVVKGREGTGVVSRRGTHQSGKGLHIGGMNVEGGHTGIVNREGGHT